MGTEREGGKQEREGRGSKKLMEVENLLKENQGTECVLKRFGERRE